METEMFEHDTSPSGKIIVFYVNNREYNIDIERYFLIREFRNRELAWKMLEILTKIILEKVIFPTAIYCDSISFYMDNVIREKKKKKKRNAYKIREAVSKIK